MKKYKFLLLVAVIAAGWGFVKFSPYFEQEAPQIIAPDEIFWDGKSAIALEFKDNSELKSVQISWRKKPQASDQASGQNSAANAQQTAANGQISGQINEQNFTQLVKKSVGAKEFSLRLEGLKPPKTPYGQPAAKGFELLVRACDASLWHWAMGNCTQRVINLVLDTRAPSVNVLAHSYSITRGGAAAVVFAASDEHLADVYIQSGSHRFKASPFKKPGFYVSLLAWDVLDDAYSADIYATDAAGNITRAHVPLFQSNRRYKTSRITASEAFVQGKIKDLFTRYAGANEAGDGAAMLDFINATLRGKNEELIHEITSRVSDEVVDKFELKPFIPLKNAAKVADFADHRYYIYKGARASESWHMGIDLASVKMAPIVLSNPGRLVFAEENGIYGLNLLVDHGLGLYSLYGHCSSVSAAIGEQLGAGSIIARTGTSGLALGDHLHFGILIQGVEVRPEEWFDRKWLQNNVFSVLNKAQLSIK